MPRPKRTPEERAGTIGEEVKSIRRRYKTKLHTRKRYVIGEEDAIRTQVAVFKIAGYSNIQIAKMIGISRNQVAECLQHEDTMELLTVLRTNLSNAAIELLQGYMIEAVQVFADVIRTEPDNSIRLKAAAEILDRSGIPKVSRSERKIEEETTTTFTDDGIVEAIRELSPEDQEQAAQMIEQLESFLTDRAQTVITEESDESD